MIFTESPLAGAYTIEPTRIGHDRGFFARTYDAEAFAARGLPADMPQCSVSFNARKGTLRGMHIQAAPHGEESWCDAPRERSSTSSSTCGRTLRRSGAGLGSN